MRKLLVLFFAILLISLSPAATFATEGNAEAKQAEYEALFDSQIKTLKSKGVSPQIIRMLSYQYYEVIEEASRTSVGDGNVAFLPVIPRSYLSVYDQMTMVESGGNKGYNYLRPSLIWDKVKTPDEPYWIFNVEDGEATRNKSPHDAEKILKNSERSPLTVAETVSLALHTRVLTRHSLDATGSRFSSYGVPSIWFNESIPKLGWVSIGRQMLTSSSSSPRRGTPSCGSRQ